MASEPDAFSEMALDEGSLNYAPTQSVAWWPASQFKCLWSAFLAWRPQTDAEVFVSHVCPFIVWTAIPGLAAWAWEATGPDSLGRLSQDARARIAMEEARRKRAEEISSARKTPLLRPLKTA